MKRQLRPVTVTARLTGLVWFCDLDSSGLTPDPRVLTISSRCLPSSTQSEARHISRPHTGPSLRRGLVSTLFCERPDGNSLALVGQAVCATDALPQECGSTLRQYVNEGVWLCSNNALFKKKKKAADQVCPVGYSLPTPGLESETQEGPLWV